MEYQAKDKKKSKLVKFELNNLKNKNAKFFYSKISS